MKIFKGDDYVKMQNPNASKPYRSEILTAEHGAKKMGGMFGLLPPGTQVPYHYHVNREAVIIAISGEAIEVIEGKETPIRAGDILFIPAQEKHSTINRSTKDFRFLEYFTYPPLGADFIAVK